MYANYVYGSITQAMILCGLFGHIAVEKLIVRLAGGGPPKMKKKVHSPGASSAIKMPLVLGPRFPNWGTRTPRGTRSGSGGTRGEHFRDNRKRTEFAECTL